MSLRALIIDDEPLAHRVILEYARELPELDIIGQHYLATEAIAALAKEEIDLIFLDIQMPKLTGLELLRTLRHPPLVIITSAYADYAVEGFELDVCDYLVKPFRFERFVRAVGKATEWHGHRRAGESPASTVGKLPEPPAPLFLKVDKRLVRVDPEDIFYLEAYGNYVKVWTADQYLLTPTTLTQLTAQLPVAAFLRVHKSFVVNTAVIAYVEGRQLGLTNDRIVPVGKSYTSDLKSFLAGKDGVG